METGEEGRAVAAATSVATAHGLIAEEAAVLHDSNRLTIRLLPCDVVARVAPPTHESAHLEVALAHRLSEAGGPVGAPDPRVPPVVHERGGFLITMWTHHERETADAEPAGYARALAELHAGMRKVEVATPHFTDRVAEAQALVDCAEDTPALTDEDRDLLAHALRRHHGAVLDARRPEQLLHGEPHPGNVLSTAHGPVFVDLETCCRGPVEFDVAHVPETVSGRYPGLDQAVLGECRALVLAMVAAWRWDRRDQLPDGRRFGNLLLDGLRHGPPWPDLDALASWTPPA